jgi:hypothetical protein
VRTTTRIVISMIATMSIAVAACSTPQSEQPTTPAANASSPGQPAPSAAAPAEASPTAAPPTAPATAPAAAPPTAPATAPAAAPVPAPVAAPEPAPAPPPPPKPKVARLTVGQPITIRTTRELSTKTAKTGDVFSAILEEPIRGDGWVVAASGAKMDGRIVEVDKASLSIELTHLTTSDGQKIEIVTSPVTSEAAASKGKDAAKVGVGAGAGAAVGAIAGGGTGAAVGALIGGGAGAVMRGDAAVILAETVVSFELRSPVTIQEKKK